MPDREKVLTWLEICGKNNDCSGYCPYSENGFGEYGQCRESLMADAYDLLKEQEAVKPILIREGRNKNYNDYVCPRCDNEVVYEQNYCSECGVKFIWEGR